MDPPNVLFPFLYALPYKSAVSTNSGGKIFDGSGLALGCEKTEFISIELCLFLYTLKKESISWLLEKMF